MTAKTNNERQRDLYARRKAAGWVQVLIWTKPEHRRTLQAMAKKLNQKEGATDAMDRDP